jgi:hypothetical protein
MRVGSLGLALRERAEMRPVLLSASPPNVMECSLVGFFLAYTLIRAPP